MPPGQGPDSSGPNFGAAVTHGPHGNFLWGFSGTPDYFVNIDDPVTEPIEVLRVWVMNQKPAHVHALGDMFVRNAQLLRNLEIHVRAQSQALFNEDWTDAQARPAFMMKGPGQVLAHLQDWATQQALNKDAMYALVDPIQKSQTDMEALWARYHSEVAAAGEASFMERWATGISAAQGNHQAWTQLEESLAQRQDAKREEFHQAAREIVRIVSAAYADQFRIMRNGVGVPYVPPNVMMSQPGVQWPTIPAVGAPNLAGLGVGPPNVTAPPAPPAIAPPNVQALANTVPNITAPVLQDVPGARNLTNLPTGPQVTAPTVGPPPGVPALPTLPPGLGVGPRGLPNGLTAPNISAVPGGGALSPRSLPAGFATPDINAVPGAGTGVAGPGAAPGALPPPGMGRGISRGVLGRPGSAPGGVLPPPGAALGRRNGTAQRGSTVRSPAANYTGTGRSGAGAGVLPPPGVNTGRRQGPGTPGARGGPVGVPEAFTGRSGGSMPPPPVPPVLGRQSRRGQPGQHGVYTGPQVGDRGAFAPPPSATPPVLNAQSRAGGTTLPPPAGIAPQRRRRAEGGGGQIGRQAPGGMSVPPGGFAAGRRTAGRYTDQPGPNLVGNPDWLAETTPDATTSTAPVLRNQMAADPAAGALPPMMPSVPGANAPVVRPAAGNRQAPAGAQRHRQAASRSGLSEAELARRTREQQQPETRPGEEEAFTMQTPGGPVVGSTPARPDEAPKPTIRNA